MSTSDELAKFRSQNWSGESESEFLCERIDELRADLAKVRAELEQLKRLLEQPEAT